MPLLALPFPAIDPILIEIGPFAIRWYALAYIAGLLFGWWYVRRLVTTERLWDGLPRPAPVEADDLLVYMVFGIILGGRIGYVLFYNFASYADAPWEILAVWHGGMSIHGGLLGAALAQWIFARRRGHSVWTVFDLTAAAVPVGLFLGRCANFINGELFGRVTDVPWAVVFPTGGDLPRHPSQLYEAVLEGLVLGIVLTVLVWRFRALRRPGLTVGVFGVGYALSRILVEFVREPDPQVGFLFAGTVTMGMALSAAMALAGLAMIAAALTGRTRR
jgi:phosphatidylglycerol:prolipoprotein diacylglycerol transferase